MNDMCKTIEDLCKNKKVNITTMCKESGANRGSITDFKMGRTKQLSTDTLQK